MNVLHIVDRLLNGITMYRLLLYGLLIVSAVSILYGFMGDLPYSGVELLVSFFVLAVVCYGSNALLARFWSAAYAPESTAITSLILFLILPAGHGPAQLLGLAAAGLLAITSKYLLSWRLKHIFNPAAAGAFLAGVAGLAHASWWVASPLLLPFTLLVGVLVLRKLRRFGLFFTFAAVTLAVMFLVGRGQDVTAGEIVRQAFTSWPLVFLGSIMLTEPTTMPPRRRDGLLYGGLVGAIFASQVDIGPLASTPEVALLIGNLFAYAVSPKYGLRLRLREKVVISPRIYDFVFEPDRKLDYRPGQYLSWTLPMDKLKGRTDDRGNRRSFTVASSPTEDTLRLGVKFYEPSSSFKKALKEMEPGDFIAAGGLAGDFTLPEDRSQKLAFVAGGIGITPFRSMVKYLTDKAERRDVVLFYIVSDPAEIVYRDVWKAAEKSGVRTVLVLDRRHAPDDPPPAGWKGVAGSLDADMLREQAPDYADRAFFVSGPKAMVDAVGGELRRAGVRRVVTDFFSGY